jgi:hypothetical protein
MNALKCHPKLIKNILRSFLLVFAFHFSGISFCKEPIKGTLCQKPLSLVEKLLVKPRWQKSQDKQSLQKLHDDILNCEDECEIHSGSLYGDIKIKGRKAILTIKVVRTIGYPGEYNVSTNSMNLAFANIASAIVSSVADYFKKNPHINKFEIRGIYIRNEKLIDQVMRYGFKKVFSGETVLNLYIQSTLALAGAGVFSSLLLSDLNPTHKILASSGTVLATLLSLWTQNHYKTRRGNYSLTISRNDLEKSNKEN